MAALALVSVVGLAAPIGAAVDGTPDQPAVPADAWAVARTADGQLQVVTGTEAVTDLVENQADGDTGDEAAPEVLSVQTDQPVHSLGGENDTYRSQQWALDKTSFEAAWSVTRGQGVKVAVVDSGVRASHQDLQGSVLRGTDFVQAGGGDGRIDPDGHGTHIAGVIAAHVNDSFGVAGAAPGVKILPVRVLNAQGGGIASDVAKGIIWAAEHGARVINVSLGGGESDGVRQAIQYANSKGAVVLCAAGNNGEAGNAPMYPAAYPEAIAVAAVDANLSHPSWGNRGNYIDVSAPGDAIWSDWGSSNTAIAGASGTSMATPYAAAAAALVIAAHRNLSAERVKQVLEGTATHLGPDNLFGHGLVNPSAALGSLSQPSHPKGYGKKGKGYLVVSSDGRVRPFGGAKFHGDLAGVPLRAPIVASALTKGGKGYWLAGADGSVYSFGNAHYYGSMAGKPLTSPIVGMTATPTGKGYILLGADGGIFTFGNAKFYGSTGNMRLNARVLDLAITGNGKGYWFVAADGGVFTFGNAKFHGSTGAMQLAAPVMSMTSATSGRGYWMVASDGGIFAFNVPFEGSMVGLRAQTNAPFVPTVRMRALKTGRGYYLLGSDGAVYAFGTAKFFGSAPGVQAVDLMVAT